MSLLTPKTTSNILLLCTVGVERYGRDTVVVTDIRDILVFNTDREKSDIDNCRP